MSKNSIITLIILLVVVFGLWLFLPKGTMEEKVKDNDVVSNKDDSAIRAKVSEFGTKLQNVSLLAPSATLQTHIKEDYGNYITPELQARWGLNPSQALGRNVSSPWPERIDIVSVTKQTDTSYIVEGNVIEVANGSGGIEYRASYPVTLTVIKRGNDWLINEATKGDYSKVSERLTIKGVWECLPHKNTSGPQTMECAFGIKEDETGKHYAINTQLMSTYPVDYPSDTHVEVQGVLTRANTLNSDMWQRYPIEGILSATSIKKL
jgi:hypothetical protein